MKEKRQAQIRAMLEQNPDDIFLNYALAMEHVSDNEFEQARTLLERILLLDPTYLAAYYQLGICLATLGQFPEAFEILELGKQVALEQNDLKTLNEINELMDDLE